MVGRLSDRPDGRCENRILPQSRLDCFYFRWVNASFISIRVSTNYGSLLRFPSMPEEDERSSVNLLESSAVRKTVLLCHYLSCLLS
ncbi:unnamed protein product [Nezara viridula]|nr:unnamed protein product [Nezara viridula]